jgi:hypothetical protein
VERHVLAAVRGGEAETDDLAGDGQDERRLVVLARENDEAAVREPVVAVGEDVAASAPAPGSTLERLAAPP